MCLCAFLFCFVGLICLCCPWIPCLRMWAVWEGDTPVSGALWYDPYLSQRGAMVNYLTLHDESLTCIKTFQGVVSQSHQIFWHPPQTEGQGSAWVTCLLAQREPEHHTRLTHDKDKDNNDEKKKKKASSAESLRMAIWHDVYKCQSLVTLSYTSCLITWSPPLDFFTLQAKMSFFNLHSTCGLIKVCCWKIAQYLVSFE